MESMRRKTSLIVPEVSTTSAFIESSLLRVTRQLATSRILSAIRRFNYELKRVTQADCENETLSAISPVGGV